MLVDLKVDLSVVELVEWMDVMLDVAWVVGKAV